MSRINAALGSADPLPTSGWKVRQEVDTSNADETKDIADIVLDGRDATVVVENFATSDGHGHGYDRYLAYGAAGGRRSVVVLLCIRRESHRQVMGWENAVVVTYAELITDLREHVDRDPKWRRLHTRQTFFIDELARHFVEAPMDIDSQDRIAFIDAMCRTGEGVRFSYRPIDVAAEDFADLVARHARRQFEDARSLLRRVKGDLENYARAVLMDQVNAAAPHARIERVAANFKGKWEWSVAFKRAESPQTLYLDFGPTAAKHVQDQPHLIGRPDFSRIFVSRKDVRQGVLSGVDRLLQTDVTLDEVIAGLEASDTRLRDAIVSIVDG